MTRRNLLAMAAAAPLTRGLAMAAEAQKQIKITGLETDLLRLPPAQFTGISGKCGNAMNSVEAGDAAQAGVSGFMQALR